MLFCALILPIIVLGKPLARSQPAFTGVAGSPTSDVYPGTLVATNTQYFLNESQVGFPGPTATGVEPFAIQTGAATAQNGAAFPSRQDIYPLAVAEPLDGKKSDHFKVAQHWGNLSPQYSVDSRVYGLHTTPAAPETCEITQVFVYFRHGARYPTAGSPPSKLAAKLANLTAPGAPGFNVTGDIAFLRSYEYNLGAEILTTYGRKQNFDLGINIRTMYGHLLNGFKAIPVFRTQSEDRMVKTMLNFCAGFFGIPYESQVQVSLEIEAKGYNASGAPYYACANSNNARGSVGSTAAALYTSQAYIPAMNRFNSMSTGVNFTVADVSAMLNLCAYETVAVGSSEFCAIFTEGDWKAFEYAFDLSFYGNQGFGSPVAAAQGLGWVQELFSRLTSTRIPSYDSATNSTLDSSNITFPFYQPIYADAAHEVSILDAITALNLTGINPEGALPVSGPSADQTFIASRVVPFATNLVVQVLNCSGVSNMRFIINDAVVPFTKESYPDCPANKDGLCPFTAVVTQLQKRIDEIDFEYDCFANYTVPVYGANLNGRAPRN